MFVYQDTLPATSVPSDTEVDMLCEKLAVAGMMKLLNLFFLLGLQSNNTVTIADLFKLLASMLLLIVPTISNIV